MSGSGVPSRSDPDSGREWREVAVASSIIRDQVKDVVASRAFAGSKRSQEFLQLIVEHALAGRMDSLSERMIGAEMFGRPVDYDTSNDAVVRVQATVVRKKLAQYYAELTEPPSVLIKLPVGSYTPVFTFESPAEPESKFVREVAPQPPSVDLSPDSEVGTKNESGRKKLVFAVAAVILVGLIALSFIAYRSRSGPQTIHAIAILPLENVSGEPNQDYFANGVTDELIADLGQISSLRVISKTSSMTYRGTKKTLPQIARELHVDAVVEGSVLRDHNKVRITIALISAPTDQYIWGQEYVRELTNVLSLQGEVAQSIAEKIRTEVTPDEQRRLKRNYSLSPEAQDLYLTGTYVLNSGDPQNAISSLQRSVDLDPNYAPAQASLANAYGWLGSAGWLPYAEAFQKQKNAALKAIQIDDSLSEGHAELADAVINLNWDTNLAQRELARALQLNPNSASSHVASAFFHARDGQFSMAIDEVRRSLELDPVSSRSLKSSALIYYYARRYDEGLAALRKASVLDPSPAAVSFATGAIYTEKGMYKEAIEQFLLRKENPHTLGHLGNTYARAGDAPKALESIAALEKYIEKEGIGRYEIALIYAGLGDKERAFAWLDKAFEAHDKGMIFLEIDPCLDPLRSDPRLKKLITRTGLG